MNNMIEDVRYLASESPSNIAICYKGYVHSLGSEATSNNLCDCKSEITDWVILVWFLTAQEIIWMNAMVYL